MFARDAWYYFTLLKFVETYFVFQHMISPWERSMFSWEECILMLHLNGMFYINLLHPSVLIFYFWPFFLVDFLSGWSIHCCKWSVKAPANIVLLSVFPFRSVNNYFIYFGAPTFLMLLPFYFLAFFFLLFFFPCAGFVICKYFFNISCA